MAIRWSSRQPMPRVKVGKITRAGHHAHTKMRGGKPLANGGNLGTRGGTRRGGRRGGY